MKMKYKLSKRNTETLVQEHILKSDNIEYLVNHVRHNSIYKDKDPYGWPFYMITIYNPVRKEIVIGNNIVSGINMEGTIYSRDDHKYDYIINNVSPDDWLEYCHGQQDVVKG